MNFSELRCLSLLLAVFFQIPSLAAQEAPALISKAVIIERKTEVGFLEYLPKGYSESQKKFPLILFLHGGGESGDDLELVKKNGLTHEIENGREIPAIVLAPQNPDPKGLWDDALLHSFLLAKLPELRVDESRIYIMGMSRGGHGAFRLAVQHPETFAAAVIVCGGGPVSYAPWAKKVPFWFFHGDKDPVVPADESRRLSTAILKAGGEANLTIYPDTKHNAWSKAFADDRLYEWMFSKRKPTK